MEIKVTTKVNNFADVSEFVETQGTMKSLSRSAYQALKNSIVNNGFMLPMIVWRDGDKLRVIDGHQRLRTIKEMRKEGYEIDRLPYVEIIAKDEKDAKKKLLAAANQYGKTDYDGLYEFLVNSEIETDYLIENISASDFDVVNFIDNYFVDKPINLSDESDEKNSDGSISLGEVELSEDEFDALELEKKGLIRQAPIISYYGGKQRIASKIIPLIPKHTVYVEPFCGGATIFFAKPWPDVSNNHFYGEVLNDKDERLINFYKVFRDRPQEFFEKISLTPYSRKEWESSKLNMESNDDMTRALAYYYKIQTSFANLLHGGWGTGIYGRNMAATYIKKISKLPEYFERMSGVHIECKDALEVIETWDSPQTFFYCDPPYPGTRCGQYGGYTHDDLKALCDKLDAIQGSFILSNYEQDYIPKHWEHFIIKAHCCASGKGKVGKDRDKSKKAEELGNRERVEHLWRKISTVPVRPEIRALYDSGKFDCFKGGENPR